MFKAAFSGRSEASAGISSGRSSKDETRRKKSSRSHRAESVISSSSRRDDERDKENRRKDRPSSNVYDNASTTSRYYDAASTVSPDNSAYGTAPSSRVGEPRPLTASALRMLPNGDDDGDEDWVDEEKDPRGEKRSRKKESGDEYRKRGDAAQDEKERSRSRSTERKERRRESKTASRSDRPRDRDERARKGREPEVTAERSRGVPEMGSFSQFPGQYSAGTMNPAQQSGGAMMSGALPSAAPQQQFPGQDHPQSAPAPHLLGVNRADSWGAAAEYYLDEGQSVGFQPGNRPFTPNMLANPDHHLVAASAEAVPAQDTGNGTAADFFNGKVSPVPFTSAPTTPAKPPDLGNQSSFSAGKPSKPHRTSSLGAAAAALAAAGGAALAQSSHRRSSTQQQTTSSTYRTGSSSSKPTRSRHSSDGGVYYSAPPPNNTYPPALPSANDSSLSFPNYQGTSRQHSTNSNMPLYAAGAAAAAGLAAHEYDQRSHNNGQSIGNYGLAVAGGSEGAARGLPRSPQPGFGGYGGYPPGNNVLDMQQQHHHEHKGPITRLKDGLFNLISSPEDTAKMEMYTEYIGVCKHCFDPRTSAWDAPRVHHYHKRRDSFEDLRRRRSGERIGRRISNDSLRRQGSARVDKDSRYYASGNSRTKRESNGVNALGAGLAAAGAVAGANALFNDRKNFDDTYSVKSGHRESSAIRRRSHSSSSERRRQSTYGVVRPGRDDYVTARSKDRRQRGSRKSRSNSRDRKSSHFGPAVAGAALGAAALAATSRRHSSSRSRSRSPSVLNGAFGTTSQSRRDRRSSVRSSSYKVPHEDREDETTGFFGSFFSPPSKKRRSSRDHQKKRRGFFTFSNGSSSSSNSELAFGDGASSRTNLPLRRKTSSASNRSSRRTTRRKSDDHIAATVAGLGATAAALAAAQRGHRVNKRTSRPELGKRRDVKHSEPQSDDDDWEDELPSDVDDDSSIDGGLAFGDYAGRRLSSRQSLESVGSQSSAGGLSAWGWRWGGKDRKRRADRKVSAHEQPPSGLPYTSVAGPAGSGLAAGAVAGAFYDGSRPIDRPVYLDDTGRPLPSVDSASIGTGAQRPMQYVDPRPISDAGSISEARPYIPGSFDQEPPVIRSGPGPIQQPRPIAPSKPSFTESPPPMDDLYSRPGKPRRANSSPTRGHFARDAALVGGAALATASILSGAGGTGRRSKEPSNVRFGLTEEQQRKENREKEKKLAEERRRADRTRALKEEADRSAREAREEEVRRAREEENRRAAQTQLALQREVEERLRREAQERADRERALEQEAKDRRAAQRERQRQEDEGQRERERLEREARDRREAAAAATAEVERVRLARENAERQAELRERERRDREAAAREEDDRRRREAEEHDRYVLEQADRFERSRKSSDARQSMPWGAVAAGTVAAASIGAAMAGGRNEKTRDRTSQPETGYDDATRDRQRRRFDTDWEAEEKSAARREAEEQAELDRRARERYGRSNAGVELRDGYVAAEIKPKNEHEGEPLMDDDIYDPNYFHRRHTPAENARYADFARRAAEKVVSADTVVSDREGAYADKDQSTSYADFFAPKDLLSKAAEGKTRSVSPDPDNVVHVWHSHDAETRSPYSAPDYGYGAGKYATSGVPRLNVIAPTPPPGSGATTPERRQSKGSVPSSPLSKAQDAKSEASTKSDGPKKSERSRSISWGEDKTHIYDVQTPESYNDRDSYIAESEHGYSPVVAAVGAGAAAAVFHDATVEKSDRSRTTYDETERDRVETGYRDLATNENKDEEAEKTSTPQIHGFYRQPYFDSVSDVGTGIPNMNSPSKDNAPPQKGFIEGETDEPVPRDEKAPHVPGGFDDEMDDLDQLEQTKPKIDASADADLRDNAAQPGKDARDTDEPQWEPPLSKKEKKKREKAAKRAGSLVESNISSTAKETTPEHDGETPSAPAYEAADYPSPRFDEGRNKADQTSLADIAASMMSKPSKAVDEDTSLPTAIESGAPLSKKEQKKLEKQAKKQGFADIADNILAAGGVAAAAADNNEDASFQSSSKKKKKGKKSKLGESNGRDLRDLDLSQSGAQESSIEPGGMPGGWDSEKEAREQAAQNGTTSAVEMSSVAPEAPSTQETDQLAEWSETPKKSKKKSKRGSAAFNLPDVSSPLRSEVPRDDYLGRDDTVEAGRATDSNAHINGDAKAEEYGQEQRSDNVVGEPVSPGRESGQEAEVFHDTNEISESPRAISPEDAHSDTYDPDPDGTEFRRSHRSKTNGDRAHAEEPSYAYEAQSVTGSEPGDFYDNTRKSKRRSRHIDDDDAASVTSSRSRREREREESPTVKKEKKGGLFGLFGRKSVDEQKSSKGRDKQDGAPLSRESTRESRSSRYDDDEDSRRHHRKHKDSEYGDDDDVRSVKSQSRRRHSTREDEDYDRSSPARSEPGHRHHHRRRTDDDGDDLSRRDSRESRSVVSESGHRHHHRRRTDEQLYGSSSRDQSFLGMRVEDLPPLPASHPSSAGKAAEKQEQGEGSPASAIPDVGLVRSENDINDITHNSVEPGRNVDDQVLGATDDALALPVRPNPLHRPISATAVPLRFPGVAPQTPAALRDRAQSFSSPISAGASPASPAQGKQSRQGRPHSSEIRPLYLLERNGKTPEVEDALPSLPSSKPSSRSSSIHGSEENYQSAVEDMESDSPGRARKLRINTSEAAGYHSDDLLDSQQATPKALEFPQPSLDKLAKQEPQYYTWEDFAREEGMHEDMLYDRHAEPELSTAEADLQLSKDPRSNSPLRSSSTLISAAATAAVLGGAAVIAHQHLRDPSPERLQQEEADTDPASAVQIEKTTVQSPPSLSADEPPEPDRGMPSRKGSSKKKKGKKGKKQEIKGSEAQNTGVEPAQTEQDALQSLDRESADAFVEEEADMEAGRPRSKSGLEESLTFLPSIAAHTQSIHNGLESGTGAESPITATAVAPPISFNAQANDDREVEEQAAILPSTAAHTLPLYTTSTLHSKAPSVEQHPTPASTPTAFQDVEERTFFSQERSVEEGSTFLPSAAAHTMAYYVIDEAPQANYKDASIVPVEEPDLSSSGITADAEASGTEYASAQGRHDEILEPATQSTAEAQSAPLDFEQRNFQVEQDEPANMVPTPTVTRKQSKRAKKKKQKGSAMTQEVPTEEPEPSNVTDPGQEDVGELGRELERSSESTVDHNLQQAYMDEAGIHSEQPAEERIEQRSNPKTALKFGMPDFSNIAHNNSSPWQDAQSQAFEESMLRAAQQSVGRNTMPDTTENMSALTDSFPLQAKHDFTEHNNDQIQHDPELGSTSAPILSEIEEKKDQTKELSTWSEGAAEEELADNEQMQAALDDGNNAKGSLEATATSVGLAVGAGLATTALSAQGSEELKPKKKAKKDKKKKTLTSSEPEPDLSRDEQTIRNEDFTEDLSREEPAASAPYATDEHIFDTIPGTTPVLVDGPEIADESSPSVSNKKGKKKKKKTQSWFAADQQIDQTSSPQQLSVADATLLETSEPHFATEELSALPEADNDTAQNMDYATANHQPADGQDIPDPPSQPVDILTSASKRKAKKDKKKKQAIDWTQVELQSADEEQASLDVKSDQPAQEREVVTETAEDSPDAEGLKVSGNNELHLQQPSFQSLLPGQSLATPENIASATSEYANAANEPEQTFSIDLPLDAEDMTQEQALDSAPTNDPTVENSEEAFPSDFAPATSKKKSKKNRKKSRQEDWTENKPVAGEHPTSDKEIVIATNESVTSSADRAEPTEMSGEDPKEEQVLIVPQETVTPALAAELGSERHIQTSPGTEQEQKQQQEAWETDLWLESKSSTVEGLIQDTSEGNSSAFDTKGAEPIGYTAAENNASEIASSVSKKQAKKDKKKKKQQQQRHLQAVELGKDTDVDVPALEEAATKPLLDQQQHPRAVEPFLESSTADVVLAPEDVPLPEHDADDFFVEEDIQQNDPQHLLGDVHRDVPSFSDSFVDAPTVLTERESDTETMHDNFDDAVQDLPAGWAKHVAEPNSGDLITVVKTAPVTAEAAAAPEMAIIDTYPSNDDIQDDGTTRVEPAASLQKEAEQDLSWGAPSKKKGKKGKKSRQLQAFGYDEVPAEIDQQLDIPSVPPAPASTDYNNTEPAAFPDVDQTVEKSRSLSSDVEAEQELSAATTSKKKAKKVKKSRQSNAGLDLAMDQYPETANEHTRESDSAETTGREKADPAIEVETEVNDPIEQPIADKSEVQANLTSDLPPSEGQASIANDIVQDEIASDFGSKKKKSKKGKKGKQTAFEEPDSQIDALAMPAFPEVEERELPKDNAAPQSSQLSDRDEPLSLLNEPQEADSSKSSSKKGKKSKKSLQSTANSLTIHDELTLNEEASQVDTSTKAQERDQGEDDMLDTSAAVAGLDIATGSPVDEQTSLAGVSVILERDGIDEHQSVTEAKGSELEWEMEQSLQAREDDPVSAAATTYTEREAHTQDLEQNNDQQDATSPKTANVKSEEVDHGADAPLESTESVAKLDETTPKGSEFQFSPEQAEEQPELDQAAAPIDIDPPVEPNPAPSDTPSSKKKKGKKGKKSGSGLATPNVDEAGPLTVVNKEVQELLPAATNHSIDRSDAGNDHDDLISPTEPEISPEEMQEATPTDSTFADIWANEDLVTQDDPDSVRDFIGEPTAPDSSNSHSSSKKSKKKKGKRASIVDNLVSEQPGLNEDDAPPDVRRPSQDEDATPKTMSEGPYPSQQLEEEASSWVAPISGKKKGKKGKKNRQASLFEDQPSVPAPVTEEDRAVEAFAIATDAQDEPASDNHQGLDTFAKPETEDIGQSSEPALQTEIEALQHDDDHLFSTPNLSEVPSPQPENLPTEQSLLYAKESATSYETNRVDNSEVTKSQDTVATREDDLAVEDVNAGDAWTSEPSKKKGKKGKKSRQSTAREPDLEVQPETLEQGETLTSSADIGTPLNDVSEGMQTPREAEAADVWDNSNSGKKSKKNKKKKQAFTWSDEPAIENDGEDDTRPDQEQSREDQIFAAAPSSKEVDTKEPVHQPALLNTDSRAAEPSTEQPEPGTILPSLTTAEFSAENDLGLADSNDATLAEDTMQENGVPEISAHDTAMEGMDVNDLDAVKNEPSVEQSETTARVEKEPSGTGQQAKKGKKGKKKKTLDARTDNPEASATAEHASAQTGEDLAVVLGATAALTATAAGVASEETTPGDANDDEWPDFSSKKSKTRKKNKASVSVPPQANQDVTAAMREDSKAAQREDSEGVLNELPTAEEHDHTDSGLAEQAWDQPLTKTASEQARDGHDERDNANPVYELADGGMNDKSILVSQQTSPTTQPARGDGQADNDGSSAVNATEDTSAGHVSERLDTLQASLQGPLPHDRNESDEHAPSHIDLSNHSSRDIDFTATVAAGLADSGFDPDMVINDPTFQRRMSPPGVFAEANPDESYAQTTSRRKKGKKSKQSGSNPASPAMDQAESDIGNELNNLPIDEFNDTLGQSLAATGFDPALLEKALTPEPNSWSQGIADEPEDFSNAMPRRKKKKKGKKVQDIPESVQSTDDASTPTTVGLAQPGETSDTPTHGVAPIEESSSIQAYIDQSDDISLGDRELVGTDSNALPSTSTQSTSESNDVPVNILTVGGAEMDMDEMDQQLKAYKKNKRKQKKLKAREAGLSAPTNVGSPDTSAAVSENEPLSRKTTSNSASGQTTVALDKDRTRSLERSTITSRPESLVHSVFPGLERVKRRMPSMSEEPTNDRGFEPAAKPKLHHVSDIAETLLLASPPTSPHTEKVVMKDKPSSSHFRQDADSHAHHDDAMATGIGAVAAMASAGMPPQTDLHEPGWSFDTLQDHQKHPVGDSREPIRDSGYQENENSLSSAVQSSREIPGVVRTSSSRDSLRERRSLEPLHIPTSPNEEISATHGSKERSIQTTSLEAGAHSRTPSANTPLRPTSKDRTSYLFQSPPDVLAAAATSPPRETHHATQRSPQPGPHEVVRLRSSSSGYDETSKVHAHHTSGLSARSPMRSPMQSPVQGPLSPRLALDAIPEERHASKRSKAESDVGGPEQIKAVKRAGTPQSVQAQQRALSPSVRGNIAAQQVNPRAMSNPLSTDELIKRLSWPAIDDQNDTVNIDRHLGHKYSTAALPHPRSPSAMSNRSNASGAHFRSPQELRSFSRTSNHSHSSTPSLRRVSLSGDLRAASRRGDAALAVGALAALQTIPFEPPPTPPLNDEDSAHGSLTRGVDMNDDVFQGYGDAQRSQVSPTRPPSVRKRQSMHITELESKLDQLTAENRALQDARQNAGNGYDGQVHTNAHALQEALMERDAQLKEKDAKINQIKAMLEPLHEEIARLNEINGGLTESNRNLVDDANGRYATLQAEHSHAHEQWQSASRELDTMRSEHGRITSGMKDIVEAEVATALADKNAEILRLREQLDIAAEQIRALQVQIQGSKGFLSERDEDYFDGACQKLCQHVQQWVLRFSKVSDKRVCRLSSELNDDKIETKLDNAILDGSDVDKMLGDRVRRRDVFMSVVMTMVWENIFTRYLCGMDREQRQKLKALEKTLAQVGPPRAVAHWRATTLTLLSKRPAFATQYAMDTEAVAHEIFHTLSTMLPPPSNAKQQLLASLLKVINIAGNLSIEMRTQRAEYIMLPPLQPEYDTNGDLVRKVYFNASLMNERSGFFSSNEELAAEEAVVKIVLFPLVVKKGDEVGEGEEEIVVCPAQVLVQNEGNRGKKVVRVMSGAMEIDDPIRSRPSNRSLISEAPGSVGY